MKLEKIAGVDVLKLAEEYGTPLYVYDTAQIRRGYKKIDEAFSSRYKNFRILYSVKVNNNLAIMKFIHGLGAGFDCSSMGEIYLGKKVRGAFLSYVGNYNSDEELKYALDRKVNSIILDDISLTGRLKKFGIDSRTGFGFRINADLDIRDDSFISLSGRNSKFGIPETEIIKGYTELKKLGARKFGIHMMLGSNVANPSYFESVAKKLMSWTLQLKEKAGIDMDFIDMGGGYGIKYGKEDNDLDIDAAASAVTGTIKSAVRSYRLKEPVLVVEPGRYIMGHAGYLLGKVQVIKRREETYAGCDISINSIPRIPLFKAVHRVSVSRAGKRKSGFEAVNICGQICWDGDILRSQVKLPPLDVGDIIILHDAGAYGFCHSNQFNTRQRPAEVMIHEGKTYIIREREKIGEFDRLARMPQFLK